MALTQKQIDALTLKDLRRIADHIKAQGLDVRALLGGPDSTQFLAEMTANGPALYAAPQEAAKTPEPIPHGPRLARPLNSPTPQPIVWTPEEQAFREQRRLERLKTAQAEADTMDAEFQKALGGT